VSKKDRIKFLQVNLNRHWAAQNLLMQNMFEQKIDIACVCEPASAPRTSPRWVVSGDGLAAIFYGSRQLVDECVSFNTDRNFVVIKYKYLFIISVYIAPSESDREFNVTLDRLAAVIRSSGGNCIIAGDFNAKSPLWGGPRTNWRGSVLERWAAGLELRIINVGNEPTCIKQNGSSIIDLTWSSANICRLFSDWRVLNEAVSLSDHQYIVYNFGESLGGHTGRSARYPRWNVRTLDRELFREAVGWLCEGGFPVGTVDDLASGITRAMSSACDVAMKRLKYRDNRRGVYWWSETVAQARKRYIAVRRLLTRVKRRGGNIVSIERLYREARAALCKHIKKAKSEAWGAFIQTLDSDPWGLPYKLVMDRLRRSNVAITELLEPDRTEELLNDLFPAGEVHDPESEWRDWDDWSPEWDVTMEEVNEAIRGRRRGGCPAPGPDGLTVTIWRCAATFVVGHLAALYTLCLERGRIPSDWKRAILVLIPKGKFSINSPKVRPICLLNDVGKFFERILDKRLKTHLATLPRLPAPSQVFVSGMQFGFREGFSTIDALDMVTNYIRDKTSNKKLVLALSLDIKNAFNSLSWNSIRWALRHKKYPEYLRRIIDWYLFDRYVEYPVRSGAFVSRRVTRGVPQGSVLGPLLWNIAYDYVLRIARKGVRPGCSVIGYADDTLIMCAGKTGDVIRSNVNAYIKLVVKRMEFLALEVAPEKTEAVLFRGRNRLVGGAPTVRLGNSIIPIGTSMKYLGVILDSKLSFKQHFTYVGEKVGRVSRALGCLMPNLRGPMESKRRLYASVIASVVLYAAPIWADSLVASKDSRRLFRQWQRVIALRVCSAYRSVSYDSSTLLARLVPYELLAAERARIFWRVQDSKELGNYSPELLRDISRSERTITQRQWELFIRRPDAAGVKLRDAILPCLKEWMTRPWGGMSFHVTQLLTGHGCFGTFLLRIGKADSAVCPFCNLEEDSADHTIQRCPEWRGERQELVGTLGPDLSLPGVIRGIVGSREGWIAFARFADSVMLKKENAERSKEMNAIGSPEDPG